MPDAPQLPPVSPEHRKMAADSFQRANQLVQVENYEYGIKLLLNCCKFDPGNLAYRQALRKAQKAKFGNDMRGSSLAMVTTAGTRAKLKSAKRAGDHVKVLEHGEDILCANPWDLGVQMDMAESADALGQTMLAIWILDQARQKHPNDINLNRALARLFEKHGDFQRATVLWNLVRQADPSDHEASGKATSLAASATIAKGQYEQSTKPKTDEHVPLGAARPAPAEPERELDPAERAERQAAKFLARTQSNPADVDAYLQVSAIYRRVGQREAAREVVERGLGPTGKDFRLQVELIDIDLEPFRQNLQLTEERIDRAAKGQAGPDEPGVDHLKKIRLRLLKEINAREIDLYRLHADRNPSDPTHRIDLGVRLLRSGQVDAAIQELQQGKRDQRQGWRALMYLGFSFKQKGLWKLAERNFEEALKALPPTEEDHHKEILFQLAAGAADTGDYGKALEVGHELANMDFGYRDIGNKLGEWEAQK